MPIEDFELERFFARFEFSTPYLLCASDCESMRVADLLALEPDAAERLHALWLGYTESQGDPSLRDAVAALCPGLDAAQVLAHAGAEEAIFSFAHTLLAPGDHVVVQTPCYQSLFSVARSVGCDVTPWTLRTDHGWGLDADALPGLLRPTTRAVVINSPHNPTGHQLSEDTLRRIAEICDERGIILFCDEVYRESEHQGPPLPAACTLSERAISLGVMSKSYGLAGLRVGWIATRNREVYAKMAAFKDYTTICNSAPSEFLAALALRHRTTLAARNVTLIRRNLALADAFFARHAGRFEWIPPQAGPIAFPALRNGDDVEPLALSLARDHGVLLLPGYVYGNEYRHHFRIGLGRENFPQGLQILETALKS